MSFVSSISSRACLNDWDCALAANDILSLLLALKRAMATAESPVILLLVVRETVPVPANFLLNCLEGTLPAILNCCEQLVIAVEGSGADRSALRATFQTERQAGRRRARTAIFDSLSDALAHAQRSAPHDVLELQRHLLQHSCPPNGKWT